MLCGGEEGRRLEHRHTLARICTGANSTLIMELPGKLLELLAACTAYACDQADSTAAIFNEGSGCALYLGIALPILDHAPRELGQREGCGEAELEIGAASLIIASAQVLPTGALAFRA